MTEFALKYRGFLQVTFHGTKKIEINLGRVQESISCSVGVPEGTELLRGMSCKVLFPPLAHAIFYAFVALGREILL